MRPLLLIAVLALTACATTAPKQPSPPQPIQGESLVKWTSDDGLEIEVLLTGTEHPSAGKVFGPARLPGKVATSIEELPLEFRPQQRIDFSRWVAVTSAGLAPELVVNEIPTAALITTPEQTEFTYPTQQELCGGASITNQRNIDQLKATPRRLLLIPRPAKRLVIGLYDTRCPGPLP